MSSGPLAGLHVVLVPTWYPTPERPTGGRIFQEYIEAFMGAGARVGVLYPDLVDLKNLTIHAREEGYWKRVQSMRLPLSLWPILHEESFFGASVVRVRGLHTSFGRKERRIDRYSHWLRRAYETYAARHGTPDILHAHCAIPAGWASLRLVEDLNPRPRVVLTEHTGPFELLWKPAGSADPVLLERTLAACRDADALAAVSQRLIEEMHEAGVSRDIEKIPNAVSTLFGYSPAPPVERTTAGKPRYRALYAGRFSKKKGIPELALAIERVAQAPDLEVHWDFFGFADEGEREEEERLIRVFSSGPAKGMGTLHGMQPREVVAPATKNAHFMVLPSHRDNCPLAVVEARSVGRPTVGTRDSGVEGYVEDGKDGLLSRVGDPDDLTRAILELLRPYDRWDAREIAERADAEFSEPAIARRYAKLFTAAPRLPDAGAPATKT